MYAARSPAGRLTKPTTWRPVACSLATRVAGWPGRCSTRRAASGADETAEQREAAVDVLLQPGARGGSPGCDRVCENAPGGAGDESRFVGGGAPADQQVGDYG